jgi:hypothetical protein
MLNLVETYAPLAASAGLLFAADVHAGSPTSRSAQDGTLLRGRRQPPSASSVTVVASHLSLSF